MFTDDITTHRKIADDMMKAFAHMSEHRRAKNAIMSTAKSAAILLLLWLFCFTFSLPVKQNIIITRAVA